MKISKIWFLCAALFLASSPTNANEIYQWNDVTLDAIRTARLTPPFSSRALAMVHIAMFDAVNAIEKRYEPYLGMIPHSRGLSTELAAASAARTVLVNLMPLQKYAFERVLDSTKERLKAHPKTEESLKLGHEYAAAMLLLRHEDAPFMESAVNYVMEPAPGKWVPTLPTFESPLVPKWGQMQPFALQKGDQFRSSPPPALDSETYRKDLTETFSLGAKASAVRTPEQTEIAKFWADGSGTYTPPGHYNILARTLSAQRSAAADLLESAHMLALLNIALADAAIACWDVKFTYWFWRPVSAIRETLADGKDWEPLLFTPYFPEYVSGHSTFSGAAQAVLSSLFGTDEISFEISSDSLPGVTRKFSKISQATNEAGRSRIYGGIHFEFSNMEGQRLGQAVGNHVLKNVLKSRK